MCNQGTHRQIYFEWISILGRKQRMNSLRTVICLFFSKIYFRGRPWYRNVVNPMLNINENPAFLNSIILKRIAGSKWHPDEQQLGNFLEARNLQPLCHETQWVAFNRLSRWFWCILKFQSHWDSSCQLGVGQSPLWGFYKYSSARLQEILIQ